MEVDKSIALQKQVRDNSDTLRNEFLDMKNWEQQMKKVDMELRGSLADQTQTLPPIRRKKTSSRSKSKIKDNGSKSKRIKSYDYSAWDNFDVDKACEEIDKENESEDSGEELLSKEELEKNHEEATKHKVMGNKYVKEQKWDEAMACYSEAIKVFPHDAVFYANRALCHLKMDNLYSAESDCTAAIQRDELYVKAYHRRATARMALKQYPEAIQDLEKLLSLEADNKEAKKMLITAKKARDASKPLILSSTKEDSTKTEKPDKPTITLKIVDVKDPEILSNEKPKGKVIVKELEPSKIDENKIVEKPKKHRDWLPEIENDVEEIRTIDKLPHQRLQKPLKSVPIAIGDLQKLSVQSNNESETNARVNDPKIELPKLDNEREPELSVSTIEKFNLPPIPKTAVQFSMSWFKCKSSDYRYQYLKQIPAESFPKIFLDSMESDTFSEIVNILADKFILHKDTVFNYLTSLTEIKRFRTLTMFMGKKEKEALSTLLEYCRTTENRSIDEINHLRTAYEL